MRALGKLVGKSRSGRWIIRGETLPPLGASVVDKDLVPLGRVVDAFGPVDSPFVSVRQKEPSIRVSPGDKVYFLTPKDRRMGKWRSSTT